MYYKLNYLINHGWNVGTSSELAANGDLMLVNGIKHGALFSFMFPCYKSAAEFVMFFLLFSVSPTLPISWFKGSNFTIPWWTIMKFSHLQNDNFLKVGRFQWSISENHQIGKVGNTDYFRFWVFSVFRHESRKTA